MSLVQIAFLMLVAGAGGGLLFTTLIAMKKRYTRWFGKGHGLLGLSALGVLGYALLEADAAVSPTAWWSLGLLCMAWCGGLLLFRVVRPKVRPLLLAFMHGSIALAGLYLLYQVAF